MPANTDYDTALDAGATAYASADYAEARKQIGIAGFHLARMKSSSAINGASVSRRALKDLEDLKALVDAAEKRSSGGKFEIHSTWVP